jgi:hypothetical protein
VVIVWLNLLFLFFLTIIPFAVDLQIDYGLYQVIFILYALTMTSAGLLLTMVWLHAMKGRLIDKTMNQTEIQSILLESIVLPSVFVISIFVSIVDLEIAYYFWMVIIPAKVALRWKYPH